MADKALITQALSSVPKKLDDLLLLLDETKKDVIKRKCEPPPGRMAYLELQSAEMQTQMDGVIDVFSKENKQKWKKIWEQELGAIVQEQTALKSQEQECTHLDEKLDGLLNEMDDVNRVLELIKKNGGNAPAFVPAPPPPDFIDDTNQGVKDILLTQIKSQSVTPAASSFLFLFFPCLFLFIYCCSFIFRKQVNSEQRLKALEASEKTRQIDKMMKKGDEFEEELKGFVGQKKFKTQGGVEAIEALRLERDRENLKAGLQRPPAPEKTQ